MYSTDPIDTNWTCIELLEARKETYRGRLHTAVLKLLEAGSRSLGSLDELKVGLAAVEAMGLGHVESLFQQRMMQKSCCFWKKARFETPVDRFKVPRTTKR